MTLDVFFSLVAFCFIFFYHLKFNIKCCRSHICMQQNGMESEHYTHTPGEQKISMRANCELPQLNAKVLCSFRFVSWLKFRGILWWKNDFDRFFFVVVSFNEIHWVCVNASRCRWHWTLRLPLKYLRLFGVWQGADERKNNNNKQTNKTKSHIFCVTMNQIKWCVININTHTATHTHPNIYM